MSLKYLKQESIPVGCIPPPCRLGVVLSEGGGGAVQGVLSRREVLSREWCCSGGAVQGGWYCSGGGAVHGMLCMGVVLSRGRGAVCSGWCCLRGASITECDIIAPLPPVNRMTGRQV